MEPAYVGRILKLAYLAPAVLEKLLIARVPPAVSVKELAAAAELPWVEQDEAAFSTIGYIPMADVSVSLG